MRGGETNRLILNGPPCTLKSLEVSVAFPAYLLGLDPTRRIFTISYADELAAKHTSDFRSIVESRWYRLAFRKMRIQRMHEGEVITTQRGFRKSTSVYGALTGLGGDLFIIDDPQKTIDAQSETRRKTLNEWFSHTLVSRLDDKRKGAIIVVMQRVHMDDLSGYLIESPDDWTVLSLPAIAESADEQIPVAKGTFHQREIGEALHPSFEPIEVLRKQRETIGSEIFAAQYQQCPVPQGGAMIKRRWLRYYDTLPPRSWNTHIILSWDTAAKNGAQNDWSVCTVWMLAEEHFYLLDLIRGRYEYPQLRSIALALAKKYDPNRILIEDASTGIALAQELRQAGFYMVDPIPVERDKIGRLYIQQAKFEAGLVLFPRGAAFLPELEPDSWRSPEGRPTIKSTASAKRLRTSPDITSRRLRPERPRRARIHWIPAISRSRLRPALGAPDRRPAPDPGRMACGRLAEAMTPTMAWYPYHLREAYPLGAHASVAVLGRPFVPGSSRTHCRGGPGCERMAMIPLVTACVL
jgi:predicted phage terminase large subunit-like protein